ncbi:hypothetical protein IEQ34_001702 [Dendrobium chrysotoxum]|uniref:Pentatricopeptide repeat-containing protein n=1 Tax=Dendrobium chrysotoxum TaxID=161865 RepID=A0AAV7H8M5_DENCH|nr:hypothetical protein IEQ34_001702 [Dendrobium chrysotoxum]
MDPGSTPFPSSSASFRRTPSPSPALPLSTPRSDCDPACAAVEDSSTALAFSWNILISAYLQKGYWQDAIFSYGMMLESGIKPDKFSISSVLKACGELRELGLGKEVHRHIGSSDLECDLFVYDALLDMYVKCGAVDNCEEALTLISQTRQRKAISALDSFSLLLGLKACSVIRYLTQGKEIHGLAIRSNFDELENISNAIYIYIPNCR